MFYIDHILKDGRLAVADTDDGVIDIVSQDEYNSYINQGIKIYYWNEAKGYITSSLNRNCNYRFYRKLQRNCDEAELKEYLNKYSIYHIAQKLNEFNTSLDLNKLCRLFDYSQTQGYYILALGLTDDMTLFCIIDEEYNMSCKVINGSWHFEKFPSCSGDYIAGLINRFIANSSSIDCDETYLMLYSQDLTIICLISHYTLTDTPIYIYNPERKVIK